MKRKLASILCEDNGFRKRSHGSKRVGLETTMGMACAMLFFCVVSVQGDCQQGPDVLVQYEVSYANLSKCGFEEFTHATPPRVRIYHKQVTAESYGFDYSLSESTSTNTSYELECVPGAVYRTIFVSPGSSFSEFHETKEITHTEEIRGQSCDYTHTFGAEYSLSSSNEDNHTYTGYACDNSSVCDYYSSGYRSKGGSAAFTTNYNGYPTWCWSYHEHSMSSSAGCHTWDNYTNDTTTDWFVPISVPDFEGSNTVWQPTRLEYVYVPPYPDEPHATAGYSLTLSDEYTDGELRTNILGLMPSYSDWYSPPPVYYDFWSTIAYSVINGNHVNAECWWPPYNAELQKMKYRFVVPDSVATNQYMITWDLITWHTSTGQVEVESNSTNLLGTGTNLYSADFEVMPPDWDGSYADCGGVVLRWVANAQITVTETASVGATAGAGPYLTSGFATQQGCGSCGSGTSGRGKNQGSGGFSAEFSMGPTSMGYSAGNLRISSWLPSQDFSSPAGLKYAMTAPGVETVRMSNQVRQVKSPQTLADVVATNAFYYDIRFYLASQVGSQTNSAGVYTNISGSPFVTWKIENPDASTNTYNRVRITETRGSDVKVYDSVYTNGGWRLGYPGGVREDEWTVTTVTNGTISLEYGYNVPGYTRTVTGIIRVPGGPDQFKVKRVYQGTDRGEVMVEETVSPDSNPQVTTYIYDSSSALQKIIRPDGSWQWFMYDGLGRYDKIYSSYGNIAPEGGSPPGGARWIQYHRGEWATTYVPGSGDDGTLEPDTPRVAIEFQEGYEVARRYTAIASAGLRIEVQCADPVYYSDWANPGHLFTTNRYYTTGPNLNRLKSVVHPDGTLQTYDYAVDATSGYQTNMTASGQPNGAFTQVSDGTTNWTVLNKFGYPVLAVGKDIATGFILSQSTYTNFDGFSRPTRVIHLDGTYEDTQYACCGVDTTTDRDGVLTQYLYDAAKRPTAQTRLSITTTNVLDAAGHALQTIRKGSDASQVTLNQASFDLAGRSLTETNALGGVTTHLELTNSSAGGLIKVAIAPDGGTTTNFYYMDGSLQKLVGTAVHPVRYEYGIETASTGDSADSSRPYTLEIKLKSDGTDSGEWTKTYTDMAGRSYKTIYADNTPSDLTDNPYEKSWYNSKGQLWKQRDPDGVITLSQFNARGGLEYTAVDLDQNGSIDFSGTDRITRTVSDVTTDNGVNVRRSRSYVWSTNSSSSSNLVSVSESSTDGLRSWQTVYRDASTPVTSSNRTVYSGSNRYVTNTAPDGSYTISAFTNGRPISATRRDSINNQLSSINYGYDPHGRLSTMTDARNGTRTYTYNSGDLISSATTPNPGTLGGSAQTTFTYYNPSLQTTNVVQPDGTSVTTEYYLTGELKKTSGSRTYPVEYTYDSQGRMKTMKTWKDFASNSGTATTTWNYDLYRGWLTNKTYDGGVAGPIYTNTPAGRLAKRTWARGTTTTYAYNNGGDLTSVSYSDSTPGVTNTFDRLGRQSTIARNSITNTLAYNTANEVLSETFSGGILNGLAVTNAYDAYHRRTALGLNTQPSTLSQFGYDSASRLAGVTNGNYNSAYAYLANSPLVSTVTFRTNTTTRMTTTKTYDFLNRLTAISSVPSGTGILPVSFGYNYNNANQRTRVALADGSYWLYEYDALGQVRSGKKYWSDGTPFAGQQFEYGFDDIGNRKNTKTGGDENGWNLRSASYGANSLNQYTNRDVSGYVEIMGLSFATNSVTVNSQTAYRKGEYFRKELPVGNGSASLWTNMIVAATGQTSVTGNVFVAKTPEAYTYDADGNLTSDGRWTNRWDGENRLIGMEALSSVPTGGKKALGFVYDARGRRQSLVVSNWSGSTWTNVTAQTRRFLYDGWNLLAALDGNNSLVQSFVWGLDLSGSAQGAGGAGGLLAVNDTANGVHFAAFDGNGNLMALVKGGDGTASANYEYGPFGEVLRGTGSMVKLNPFRFSTKYQNDDSDLLYYGYRFYNSGTGRWLSRDPLFEGGFRSIWEDGQMSTGRVLREKEDIGLYVFVENATFNKFDYLGLRGEPCCECGDDVTWLVYRSLGLIANRYNFASTWNQERAEYNMFDNPVEGWDSWDMKWLKGYKSPTDNHYECDCDKTVTFENVCVNQHELNYMMFGVGISLTKRKPIPPLVKLKVLLKLRGDSMDVIQRKIYAAYYGYKVSGGTSGPPGGPSSFQWPSKCAPSSNKGKSDPDNWFWTGIRSATE